MGHAELDRDGSAVGHALDGGGEPAVGEQRGMDAVGQLAELIDGGSRRLERFLHQVRKLGRNVLVALGELKRDYGLYEPLLRAVVKVAHDATPLLVCGLAESTAGGGTLIPS